MKNIFRRDDNRGFSTIEILAVFTILAVALIPLVSIQMRARQQISESQREAQANQLAVDQIERIRAGGFANAAPDSGSTEHFEWNVAVTQDPDNQFLQEIQVRVDWSYGGEDRTLTLASKQASR